MNANHSRLRPHRPAIRRGLVSCGRGLVVAVVSFVGGVALFVVAVLSVAFLALGIGMFLLPPVMTAVRGLANDERRLARAWFGVEIPVPYRPHHEFAPFGVVGAWQRCRWILGDPATWRDLLWMLAAPVGLALGLLPAALVAQGIEGVVAVPVALPFAPDYRYGIGWFVTGPSWLMALLAVPIGALLILLGATAGPAILRLRAQFSRSLLAPTHASTLAMRVRHLARTRSEAMDTQAAELRRIERDLHDGAQARLVALGMSLGMAEDLVAKDPAAAQQLLAEARLASDQALSELRDLVRGIHPPVLAERGIDGAVRALALTLPLAVELDIDVPRRPQAPIETAAYFAVSEALANVAKHSQANRAWIRLRHADAELRITVQDNGVGGARVGAGSGLRGIERRLAAHDGKLHVSSPPGGPTVLTMELPCVLSSPKTSPC